MSQLRLYTAPPRRDKGWHVSSSSVLPQGAVTALSPHPLPDLVLSQQVISVAWSGDGLKGMLFRSRGFTPRGNRCIILLKAPGSPATVQRPRLITKWRQRWPTIKRSVACDVLPGSKQLSARTLLAKCTEKRRLCIWCWEDSSAVTRISIWTHLALPLRRWCWVLAPPRGLSMVYRPRRLRRLGCGHGTTSDREEWRLGINERIIWVTGPPAYWEPLPLWRLSNTLANSSFPISLISLTISSTSYSHTSHLMANSWTAKMVHSGVASLTSPSEPTSSDPEKLTRLPSSLLYRWPRNKSAHPYLLT